MDRYNVVDDTGRVVYSIDGKLIRYFGTLEMRDRAGVPILQIGKDANPFFSGYSITQKETQCATLKQKFRVRPQFTFTLDGHEYTVFGNLRACDFTVVSGEKTLADVRKRSLRWGDTYILSIHDLEYMPILCAMTVCLDNALFHNFL